MNMPKLHLPKFHKAQKGKAPEGSSKESLPKPASNHRGQNALAHQHYVDGLPVQNFAKVWGVENGPMNLSHTDQIIKEVEKLSITQTPQKGQFPQNAPDRELKLNTWRSKRAQIGQTADPWPIDLPRSRHASHDAGKLCPRRER